MTQILQQKCKIKGGTRVLRLRNMCLAWNSYKFGTFFISLLWVSCAKKSAWRKSEGGYSPLSPPPPFVVGPGTADPLWNNKTIMLETWNVVVSTHTYVVLENIPFTTKTFPYVSIFFAKNQHFLVKIVPLLKAIVWELSYKFF